MQKQNEEDPEGRVQIATLQPASLLIAPDLPCAAISFAYHFALAFGIRASVL
jgi:hypothetical protein